MKVRKTVTAGPPKIVRLICTHVVWLDTCFSPHKAKRWVRKDPFPERLGPSAPEPSFDYYQMLPGRGSKPSFREQGKKPLGSVCVYIYIYFFFQNNTILSLCSLCKSHCQVKRVFLFYLWLALHELPLSTNTQVKTYL